MALNDLLAKGEWQLSRNDAYVLTLLTGVASMPVLYLFRGWAQIFDAVVVPEHTRLFSRWGLLLLPPLIVLHELCHGLAYRLAGATPSYGFKFVQSMPVCYASAPGYWFTRRQYIVVGLAPTFVITAGGLVLMALLPALRYPLATALGFHLLGCSGDWWFVGVILRLPRHTEFEDTGTGFRFRLPGGE